MKNTNEQPKTKKMVLIQGKGTKNERRIVTDIDLYWSEVLKRWVSIPE
jgi:hypothetical protein